MMRSSAWIPAFAGMTQEFRDKFLKTVSVSVLAAALLLFGCSTVRRGENLPSFTGFKSQDQLVAEFLSAVINDDQAAMDRLRVTPEEYRDVIIPGTAPVGKTLERPLSDKKFEFWWSMLNQKSKDYGFVIRRDWSGTQWHLVRYWYTEPEKQYSGYRSLGQLRIAVEDGAGNHGVVRSGWIADVAGQYKFIGFEYDD